MSLETNWAEPREPCEAREACNAQSSNAVRAESASRAKVCVASPPKYWYRPRVAVTDRFGRREVGGSFNGNAAILAHPVELKRQLALQPGNTLSESPVSLSIGKPYAQHDCWMLSAVAD